MFNGLKIFLIFAVSLIAQTDVQGTENFTQAAKVPEGCDLEAMSLAAALNINLPPYQVHPNRRYCEGFVPSSLVRRLFNSDIALASLSFNSFGVTME